MKALSAAIALAAALSFPSAALAAEITQMQLVNALDALNAQSDDVLVIFPDNTSKPVLGAYFTPFGNGSTNVEYLYTRAGGTPETAAQLEHSLYVLGYPSVAVYASKTGAGGALYTIGSIYTSNGFVFVTAVTCIQAC